jgi:signal transduction histidine kinase
MWKVAVTDQGEGISDADKPYVFDRFKRVTKKGVKGTGLGLAIVKRIAELHSGDVGVENNPDGKGSRFWISLKKA